MNHRFATAVHECGHLLAAWEQNIVIRRVVVHGNSGFVEPQLSLDRYEPDRVRFFCFAGASAEAQAADDSSAEMSDGDHMAIFKAGAGGMSLSEVRAMQDRTTRWAFLNRFRLRTLARQLLVTGRVHAEFGRSDLARLVRGPFSEFLHLYPQEPFRKPIAASAKPTAPNDRFLA